MAFRYSEMGYDGCSCLSEDARCHSCRKVLSDDDGLYCDECEQEMIDEQNITTHVMLDDLGEFVTNL